MLFFCLYYFYPRPPRGGRHAEHLESVPALIISIHALREEGDGSRRRRSTRRCQFLSTPSARRATFSNEDVERIVFVFLSTPSARRATGYTMDLELSLVISIHALREEGDCRKVRCAEPLQDFYPRPPRGGRPGLLVLM